MSSKQPAASSQQGAPNGARGVGPTAPQIRPQPGPQEQFLSSPADFVLYGGAAGGGKSFALLLEALRHADKKGFTATVFRRTRPEITNEGGLWSESESLYNSLGATANQQRLSWKFPSGASVQFAQMQHEKDRFRWQGAQICYLGFDELTHFTWKQFNYMLSRNRSTCGVRPYVRATCNPDPKHWLRAFIDWWIDKSSGLPIPERSGKVRWFIIRKDEVIWADSEQELKKKYKGCHPKSFTFIAANVFDNKILLEKNPEYLANLDALDSVQKARLKLGNWNIDYTAGAVFKREWFEIVDAAPADARRWRRWDRAATEPSANNPDPDWTRGVKLARARNGIIYIEHVASLRGSPNKVKTMIKNVATQDGRYCVIGLSQDPGSAGVSEAQDMVAELAGFIVHVIRESGDKLTRALPLARQAEAGNIKLVRGDWNDEFLDELYNFPEGAHDDQVDAASGALLMFIDGLVNVAELDGRSYQSGGKRDHSGMEGF